MVVNLLLQSSCHIMKCFSYLTCCVNYAGDVDDLLVMIDSAKEIKYNTFVKNVINFGEFARMLGYSSKGASIKNDYHVKY